MPKDPDAGLSLIRIYDQLKNYIGKELYFVIENGNETGFSFINVDDFRTSMTEKEVILIANIVRYNEFTMPTREDVEYAKLSESDRLLVSKLVAIFRLCNALDKSKKQKLKNMKIKLSDENLIITAESNENVCLEKWAVDKCSAFFEEVFGLKVKLVVRSRLL